MSRPFRFSDQIESPRNRKPLNPLKRLQEELRIEEADAAKTNVSEPAAALSKSRLGDPGRAVDPITGVSRRAAPMPTLRPAALTKSVAEDDRDAAAGTEPGAASRRSPLSLAGRLGLTQDATNTPHQSPSTRKAAGDGEASSTSDQADQALSDYRKALEETRKREEKALKAREDATRKALQEAARRIDRERRTKRQKAEQAAQEIIGAEAYRGALFAPESGVLPPQEAQAARLERD